MPEPLILVINLGATSSKFAVFSGAKELSASNYELSTEQLKLPLTQQHPVRLSQLSQFLIEHKIETADISAVAARGGITKPLANRGVYLVDAQLLADLSSEKFGSHPSNLSSLLGHSWAAEQPHEIPVYIVDPVNTDTLWDEARISGVPEVARKGRHHALNIHRAAKTTARELGLPLHRTNFVVGHFGSGVSIATVVGGRTVDVNDAQLGEGPFSVSRAGTLPIAGLLQLAASTDPAELKQQLSREAGMVAYTGTADFREVEERLKHGDATARQAYEAMLFQSAKYIAAYAGSLGEQPDAIILTGGLLHSELFAADLAERVAWLGPVEILPGEDELAALAEGVAEALSGLAPIQAYATAASSATAPPRNFKEVLGRAMGSSGCRFVVAGGQHPEVAETVKGCLAYGISGFILVGARDEIVAQLNEHGVPLEAVEIVDCDDVEARAIELVQANPGYALVKGACNTKALLGGVLKALPEDSSAFLSHVAVIESQLSGRLVGVTDGGLNVEPDLTKKVGMLENALSLFRALGVSKPHVLLAAGMEDKGQDFPAIVDAREIMNRHRAGEWSEACIDGPFGIDVAFSTESAAAKGIRSPLSGHTDIIVTPNLEGCNFAVKCVTLFTGQPWGGLVMGGPFPVVLGSRSDDAHSRVCSIALAQLVASGLAEDA